MRKGAHYFSFSWYGVLANFSVERLTQDDNVFGGLICFLRSNSSPELHVFEVVEASTCPRVLLLLCSEVNRACEHALKALDQPSVVDPVRWQPELVKYVGSRRKSNVCRRLRRLG